MKARKIILLTAVLSLLFGSAAFANTISQNIKVIVNKKEVPDGGLLVDNKAYVAVGAVSKLLQGIVVWNHEQKEASIYKPNVHMFTMKDSTPFGGVEKNSKFKFRVFSQIDNLRTDITGFKVTISDPYDQVTYIDGRNEKDKDFKEFYTPGKDNFWFTTDYFTYEFDKAGPYTIQFWMQTNESPMQVVSEKVISSK